ncbi:response regulator transcription factor [Siculibacillus lacustris]|uniref:Response regulator transcription factor n=1 Tax=Siculibacillus lacustris TaxID=1549641 RepID=A0A4Q9VXY6_9HYPH|nr:response regulator transcription factor [Siculibacillus lacustris]TBW41369.1 response regulator transcription factor [Siculibacillus lacustris]
MTTAARVLVVDDEPQIHRFLKPALEASGYTVVTAEDGATAIRAAAASAPDVILLDLGLPDMDGKEVIRAVRGWSKTPIIILSARDRESEKIAALDLGADDYVNKPFGVGELLARVRTALRHAATSGGEASVVETGDLVVDTLKRTVTKAGERLRLTPKEYDLLHVLARNAGKVVTHRQLLSAVWGSAHTADAQYLRVFISQLRQKVDASDAAASVIETEPGVGYRLREQDPT